MEENNEHNIPRLTPEQIEEFAQGTFRGELFSSYMIYLRFGHEPASFLEAMRTAFLSLEADVFGDVEKALAFINQGIYLVQWKSKADSVTEEGLPIFLEHIKVVEDDFAQIMARTRFLIHQETVLRSLSPN